MLFEYSIFPAIQLGYNKHSNFRRRLDFVCEYVLETSSIAATVTFILMYMYNRYNFFAVRYQVGSWCIVIVFELIT